MIISNSKEYQINEEIRDKELRVIDVDGAQLGILSAKEALAIAEEKAAQKQESEAIRNGLCAVLRDRIIQSATYYEEKGFIPIRDMENMSLMYKAYHNLGGNGLVTKVYKEVLELPHILKG